MDEIIDILKDLCEEVGEEFITEETNFMEDLEISSLDFFSLISELEADHGITITEREIQNIITVGDLMRTVQKKMK